MNTSLHLPEQLAQRLSEYLEKDFKKDSQKRSRNALIVKAIEKFLDEAEEGWGEEVLAWGKAKQLLGFSNKNLELELDRDWTWDEGDIF